MLPRLIAGQEKNEVFDSSDLTDVSLRNYFASFPEENYLKTLFENAYVINQPMEKVGGDGYWLYHEENIIYLVVFDCMGHGRLASIMTRIYISAIRQTIEVERKRDPGDILQVIHQKIEAYFKEKHNTLIGSGADIGVLKLDRNTSQIQYSGAKLDLMYAQSGQINRIKGHKKQVGDLFDFDRKYDTIDIKGGRGINYYLFTDGVSDLIGGPKDKKLKPGGVVNILEALQSQPLGQQKRILEAKLSHWSGQNPQTDDLLFIGFSF